MIKTFFILFQTKMGINDATFLLVIILSGVFSDEKVESRDAARPRQWYCAVNSEGIVEMALTLRECQAALKGNGYQAIIPMKGDTPGDPKGLSKTWVGGSANWRDDDQLDAFRQICV